MATDGGVYTVELYDEDGQPLFTSFFPAEASMEYRVPPSFGAMPVKGFKITFKPPAKEEKS